MRSSDSGLLFAGVFKLLIQFHDWHLVSSYFVFHSDLVLGDCKFLGIHPFLLGYSFYWHIIIIIIPFDPLYFCGAGFNFPLIFFILLGWPKSSFGFFDKPLSEKDR